MELKQLEYFLKIADTGSINEAARWLNMSQPPLSYQLRQLEEELSVRLFERTSQGVTLTEAGKLLYDRSENLLNYARSAALEVSKVGKRRTLRIGITSTTVGVMTPYFAKFAQKNPDVNFEIRDGFTFSLYNDLFDGLIDISAARTPLRLDDVGYIVLRSEPMIAVSSPKLRMENEGNIDLSALKDCPLVLYRRYESLISDAFYSRNISPDIFCTCDDARDALLWAKEGLATAIFPQSMQDLCSGLCVRTLDEKELETEIVLIWRKDKKLPSIVRDFLDDCFPNISV